MPKLNFYDTDAVKAFVLNILVENEELRQTVDFERTHANAWFQDFQKQKERADKADAAIAAAVSVLSNFQKARQDGVETGWRDVDRVVGDALDILKGGEAK